MPVAAASFRVVGRPGRPAMTSLQLHSGLGLRLGLPALVAATIACCMAGAVAGLLTPG